MSTNGKTLNFRAAKIKGFTVLDLIFCQKCNSSDSRLQMDHTGKVNSVKSL